MLLGIFHAEGSLAVQILQARGVKAEVFREKLAKEPRGVGLRKPSLQLLEDFLTGLKWHSADDLIPFFAKNAKVVDVHGKLWNHEEIAENFDTLFVPYAKKKRHAHD
jgi:hypothetical protein